MSSTEDEIMQTGVRQQTLGQSVRREAVIPAEAIPEAHLREHIDPEQRRAMVADAAYFYAEHRGFEPGYELEDWLAAEDQVAATLALADLQATARAKTGKGRSA